MMMLLLCSQDGGDSEEHVQVPDVPEAVQACGEATGGVRGGAGRVVRIVGVGSVGLLRNHAPRSVDNAVRLLLLFLFSK